MGGGRGGGWWMMTMVVVVVVVMIMIYDMEMIVPVVPHRCCRVLVIRTGMLYVVKRLLFPS